jgi:hypothetical protein
VSEPISMPAALRIIRTWASFQGGRHVKPSHVVQLCDRALQGSADYNEACSLIDGAYEVVELFPAESPSQIKWKADWLAAARKHGASGV